MKNIWNQLLSRSSDTIDKETLDALLFDHLKWDFALEISNIGVWDFDADDERVTYSKESKKILGITRDDFGSKLEDWNELVHPDDLTQYFQDFQDHLNGMTPIYENISRLKHEDGSYRWILDRGKIIEYTKSGKDKRVIGVHIDITESKEHKEAVEASSVLIKKQNNKLKSFAHIASHNLKEHAGNFETLLSFYDEAKTQEEKEELFNHIKTVAKSLNKTITNLREIVSVDATGARDRAQLNLHTYIEGGIETVASEITSLKAIVTNAVDRTITINFNKAYLESIIQNLLTNALKYRHPERIPTVTFNAFSKKDFITLEITDNGLGIDLIKFGEDLFGLYKTFHHNEDSEGVGLYLTKSQLETLGGSINVSSKVDIGTKFTLKFPVIKNPA